MCQSVYVVQKNKGIDCIFMLNNRSNLNCKNQIPSVGATIKFVIEFKHQLYEHSLFYIILITLCYVNIFSILSLLSDRFVCNVHFHSPRERKPIKPHQLPVNVFLHERLVQPNSCENLVVDFFSYNKQETRFRQTKKNWQLFLFTLLCLSHFHQTNAFIKIESTVFAIIGLQQCASISRFDALTQIVRLIQNMQKKLLTLNMTSFLSFLVYISNSQEFHFEFHSRKFLYKFRQTKENLNL